MYIEPNNVITVLLAVLCSLAALDLWRQMAIRSESSWFSEYNRAVKSKYDFWKMGYRLENLDLKLDNQQTHLMGLRHRINMMAPSFKMDRTALRHNVKNIEYTRASRIGIHQMINNDTAVYQLRCENGGNVFRIGVNDFRTDERDVCQIFTSADPTATGPHTMFDYVHLPEGAFALRSMANGLFVTAVGPPPDNLDAPWKLVIGGALVGAAETFRMTEENSLYSGLMGGLFSCGSGQMVRGTSGMWSSPSKISMQLVGVDALQNAYLLSDLSRKVLKIQNDYVDKHQISAKDRKETVADIAGLDNPNVVKICMGVPMTSHGTEMNSVADSPFWTNLFDSFMKSIDWRSNRYVFRFYLGFDKADELYDIGDAWSDMREEFRHRATFRMIEQQMDEVAINTVLDKQLSLKLMHFDHLQGAPSQVVSQLMLAAYMDNYDYFYQVNDDTSIVTPNWPSQLVSTLAANPSIPNFGVTGPSDSNNEKIFTHSFVHRTHIDVFGHYFPPYFKNWWSDDWISAVYGSEHTFRPADVVIQHNVDAQKTHGATRYEVDQGAQLHLDDELRKGHAQLDSWLKKSGLPRLPLHDICGYAPLVRFIAHAVMDKQAMKEMSLSSSIAASSSYSSSSSGGTLGDGTGNRVSSSNSGGGSGDGHDNSISGSSSGSEAEATDWL